MSDSINSTSPIIGQTYDLDFSGAIRRLIDGAKITKKEWENVNIYCMIKDGMLVIHKADGKFYSWIISEWDMLGIDWVEIIGNN